MLVISPKSTGSGPRTCSLTSPKELLFRTLYIFCQRLSSNEKHIHTIAQIKKNKQEGRPNQQGQNITFLL
jgi:hypothetical protein